MSRCLISDSALKVLYGLKKAGYGSYLVGGGVRDILLGRVPKDFDVVTDANPEQIRKIFRNSRLIGRRFRLAHVFYGREIIEVSTFRAPNNFSNEDIESIKEGKIIFDNIYGNIEDDVWRRDFTVNALFYNIADYSIIDYVSGIKDLEKGQLRIIGDPVKRYIEDPVRMLRAVRLACKLGLFIHKETEEPIFEHAILLRNIPSARLFEEFLKLFTGGFALKSFESLLYYGLLKHMFPQAYDFFNQIENSDSYSFVTHALKETDQRLSEENTISPSFLLAALLWEPMRLLADENIANGMSEFEAIKVASDKIIFCQLSGIIIPKRFTQTIFDIWLLQITLKKMTKINRALSHPKFRAAYDFLLLRSKAGEDLRKQVDFWGKKQAIKPFFSKTRRSKFKTQSGSLVHGREKTNIV